VPRPSDLQFGRGALLEEVMPAFKRR
jgi:hypothetical protein